MKYLVIAAFIAILGSLGAALVFMMRGGQSDAAGAPDSPPRKNHMARALAFRVGFSILLFVVGGGMVDSLFMGAFALFN